MIADVTRDEQRSAAFRRLLDPGFRAGLTAIAADGTAPVVVADRSDLMLDVLDELDAFGGAGNLVVIDDEDNCTILAMRRTAGGFSPQMLFGHQSMVSPRCTVGVFIERVAQDKGDSPYMFLLDRKTHSEAGTAQLVQPC